MSKEFSRRTFINKVVPGAAATIFLAGCSGDPEPEYVAPFETSTPVPVPTPNPEIKGSLSALRAVFASSLNSEIAGLFNEQDSILLSRKTVLNDRTTWSLSAPTRGSAGEALGSFRLQIDTVGDSTRPYKYSIYSQDLRELLSLGLVKDSTTQRYTKYLDGLDYKQDLVTAAEKLFRVPAGVIWEDRSDPELRLTEITTKAKDALGDDIEITVNSRGIAQYIVTKTVKGQ